MSEIKLKTPEKKFAPRNQDFISYKDFTSDKSLESADFECSFGEVKGSFYSSSNDDLDKEIGFGTQGLALGKAPRKSGSKEEETNYTTKPVVILEKEIISKNFWCGGCFFDNGGESTCACF